MRRPFQALRLATLLLSASFASPSLAQDDGALPDIPELDGQKPKAAGGVTEEDLPAPVEEPAVRKEFSRAEINKICAKYKGKLIAYYGDVFRVDGCERRPIMSNKTIYSMLRAGQKVLDVDGDVIAALPEGEPVDLAMTIQSARSCKTLEGHYVTFSSVDVYFVERCKKRVFPDWESYIRHRERRGDKKGEILSLSWVEFEGLRTGEPIVSVFDDMFSKLLKGDANVDVIPVDEACEGVEGKVVSYYSRLYRVERCRKREIVDAESFLRRPGNVRGKLKELTSEQWLSLPDGQPIAEKAEKPKKPSKG